MSFAAIFMICVTIMVVSMVAMFITFAIFGRSALFNAKSAIGYGVTIGLLLIGIFLLMRM